MLINILIHSTGWKTVIGGGLDLVTFSNTYLMHSEGIQFHIHTIQSNNSLSWAWPDHFLAMLICVHLYCKTRKVSSNVILVYPATVELLYQRNLPFIFDVGSTPWSCCLPPSLTSRRSRTWLWMVLCWPRTVRRWARGRRTTPTPWPSSTSLVQMLSGGLMTKYKRVRNYRRGMELWEKIRGQQGQLW